MDINCDPQKKELLIAIREILVRISEQIECNTCDLCEKGAVYVLSFEVPLMKNLGIPLINIDGSYFFERKGEYCTAYNNIENRCRIYPERPICCRLFPMDIFAENDRLQWIVFDDCPIVKHRMAEGFLDSISDIARAMENLLTEEVAEEFKLEYKAWKKTDDPFLTIGRYTVIKDVEIDRC